MKTSTYTLGKILSCSLMIASLIVVGNTPAAQRTWGNTGTDFNSSGSWTGGIVPSGSNVAYFNAAAVTQPNLSASLSMSGLFFDNAGTSGYNITSSGGATFTFTGNDTSGSSGTADGSAAAIRSENTTGTNTVNADIVLAAVGVGSFSSFVQTGAGTLIVNGAISGNALSLRGGAGVIQLNGSNSFSALSIDTAGENVVFGNNNALGSGTFTNAATSTIQAGGGARTFANAIVLAGNMTTSGSNAFTFNGTFTSSGSNTRTLTVTNTGGVTLGGNVFLQEAGASGRTFRIDGTSQATINGVVADGGTGPATLSHGGTGTLTLNNTNTYSGGTLMSGGTTIATVDGAFGTGNVSLTAHSVTLTLQHGAVNKRGARDTGGVNDFIADTATFSIGFTDDVVNLNYTGTETINMLIVNGTTMGAGVYGSGDLPELMGTGTLTVVPEPSTWAMIVVGAGLLFATQRLRRKTS
jgi:fibronectin-binding autotransporter adhesin